MSSRPDRPASTGFRFAPVSFVRHLAENAFRVEDRYKAIRLRGALKRGEISEVEAYTGYGTTESVRVLGRVQMLPHAVRRAGRRRFTVLPIGGPRRREKSVRGWRSFVRVTVPYAKVKVFIGDQVHEITADRGGVIDAVLPASLTPGWQQVTFESADQQRTVARVFITEPKQQVGIVSDIDDTVMVTSLPRPLLAAWNTFVLDEHARAAVPGMNVLYQRLTDKFGGDTTPIVYLSTGSWNVAPTLSRFLGRNMFPFGPLLLTDWGPVPQRIFRSGTEHKRQNLRRLAQEFPNMKWLLIGDDGQHDEQIYGEFAAEFPDSVLAVAIRQLSNTESVLAGGRASSWVKWHATSAVPWVHAPNGAELVQELARIGILDHDDQVSALSEISRELSNTRVARPQAPSELGE
ncbi:App1 family protein [Gulosibacter bifidus]|uniref:App1 family protein n=1 Tax=Gulosibacter bifidus TaxID=272239 RepID=A0ABW5RK50_9MICO|nr:phosphatase domain-containing protein [Gulosibacter bifidus]